MLDFELENVDDLLTVGQKTMLENRSFIKNLFADVLFISPVLEDVKKNKLKEENFKKTLRNHIKAFMKENNCKIDDVVLTERIKIKFNIEGKFLLEGLVYFDIQPNFELDGNGNLIKEDYIIMPINFKRQMKIQNPIAEVDNTHLDHSYLDVLNYLKNVYAKKPFMYYSDVTTNQKSIILDFYKYINYDIIFIILQMYVFTGYNEFSFNKAGNTIQLKLNDINDYNYSSKINDYKLNKIVKKYETDLDVIQDVIEL